MEELLAIVSDVFGVDAALVTPDLHRDDVANWDSLGHLRLITELEDRLGVSIPIEDFAKIQTVGDFQSYLV
jgi:acyl carrier protein